MNQLYKWLLKRHFISHFPSQEAILSESGHKYRIFVRVPTIISTIVLSSDQEKHFFNFKDKIPKCLRSNVLCSFKCQWCSALYVGQMVCHLKTSTDHHHVSTLAGKNLLSPLPFSISSERTW